MNFDVEETNQKILEDLKNIVKTDAVVGRERYDSLKLDKPLVNFYIDSTEFTGGALGKTATSSLSVYVSVTKKDYEGGKSDLSNIIKEIQDLGDNKDYNMISIDYANYVEKFNTYTAMIRFEYVEKCL